MKRSNLHFVVLALTITVAATTPAQVSNREALRSSTMSRPSLQPVRHQSQAYLVAVNELEKAIRELRTALPIYDGSRSDAITSTKWVLDQLRVEDRSWPGNRLGGKDLFDREDPRRYRDSEVRYSNQSMQNALKSIECASDALLRIGGRNDRRLDQWIDVLREVQRDIKRGVYQVVRLSDRDDRGGRRSDSRHDDRQDNRRGGRG